MSIITILYDNHVFDRDLKTDWGFSALIAYQDKAHLFDTGGNGMTLLGNMGRLGIDPTNTTTTPAGFQNCSPRAHNPPSIPPLLFPGPFKRS